MIVYEQRTGKLTYVPENGNPERLGVGYSGAPGYVNDPEAQALKARGPIPRGRYRVSRAWDHVRLGPVCLFLDPVNPAQMGGRSGFLIHGDNRYGNRTASSGCIIVARSVRDKIATLAVKGKLLLDVIEG